MRNEIELFADITVLLSMLMIGFLFVQVDPLLASLWSVVTFLMTWQHR